MFLFPSLMLNGAQDHRLSSVNVARFFHRAQLIGIAAGICSVLALTPTAHSQEADERSGVTSPTSPRPGSIQAPRSYGQGGINKWFLDSFPVLPKQGGRVCGVEVQVSGFVNPGSIQNDSITVIGSRNLGLQNTGAPSWSWNFPVLGGASLAQVSGAFTKTVSITGSNWSSWLMSAPNPSLDIAVQDDTTVNAVMVTFYTY
jgi:hypothetical protein